MIIKLYLPSKIFSISCSLARLARVKNTGDDYGSYIYA